MRLSAAEQELVDLLESQFKPVGTAQDPATAESRAPGQQPSNGKPKVREKSVSSKGDKS